MTAASSSDRAEGVTAERRTRPRVLLVEDNLRELDRYASVLLETFDVLSATHGEQGYALACAERPDGTIVDSLLPDIDGLKLCERLVANPHIASIPLIVLAADDATYQRALTMPSLDAVRKKPCPADELLAVLLFAVSIRQVR